MILFVVKILGCIIWSAAYVTESLNISLMTRAACLVDGVEVAKL